MIHAHELRLGNKFLMAGGSMVNTVFEIIDNTRRGKFEYSSPEHKAMYSHLILCTENGNQYKPFEIDGVPLTQEWLERFGFEKGRRDFLRHLRTKDFTVSVYFDSLKELAVNLSYEDAMHYVRTIKFVHELQNVIHALTGEELKLRYANKGLRSVPGKISGQD